jgi:hypothetical protein
MFHITAIEKFNITTVSPYTQTSHTILKIAYTIIHTLFTVHHTPYTIYYYSAGKRKHPKMIIIKHFFFLVFAITDTYFLTMK